MNWTDYAIVGVLGVSILIGLWRGLISEVLALVIWVAAFWLAITFGPMVATFFEHSIPMPSVRYSVGYGLCFIMVLIAGALLRFMVRRLIEGTGLSGTDRLLGMAFGFARGVLLVTLAVFLVGFTGFTRDTWWQQSRLVPPFQNMAAQMGDWVPQAVRQHVPTPAQMLDHLPQMHMPPLQMQQLQQLKLSQLQLSGLQMLPRTATPASAHSASPTLAPARSTSIPASAATTF